MDNAPNPLIHAAIALAIFCAIFLVTGVILYAWTISAAFYPLHEGYQYRFKNKKGYGTAAWVVPVVACTVAALAVIAGQMALVVATLDSLPNLFPRG